MDKKLDIQFNTTTTQPAYTVRYENHQGRRHMVVPVIMMVEGVHCGSHGPVYHSADELRRHCEAWNGIPVLVNHPEQDGHNVSANQPAIVEREVLGRVYNCQFDEERRGLRAEVWLDEGVIQFRHPELMAHLAAGDPMDVSIGAFTDDEPAEGLWNGEAYTAISHNYRPDHLALLPHARGACSWADGCGLRANSAYINKDGGNVMDKQLWKAFQAAGYHVTSTQARAPQANQQGYLELVQSVQRKLDAMDSDTKLHFLEELFDDGTFVYRIATADNAPARYYRRGYSVGEQGQVEFDDTPIQVKRQVTYVEVPQMNAEQKTTKFVRTKGENQMGTNEQSTPCGCPDKVAELIAMEHYTDADREWLEKLDNAGLDRLIAVHKAMSTPATPAEDTTPAVNTESDAKQEPPAPANAPQLNEAEYLATLPPDLRRQMEYGMKLYRDHRAALKQSIMDNTDVYTADELELQSDAALEKLAKVIRPAADYSVAGGSVQSNARQDDILLPPGVKASK